MKKKILICFLFVTFLFTISAQAQVVEFVLDDTKMNASSDTFVITSADLPAAPFILNDRTMVPVRALSEQFGAAVGWNPDTRTVSVKTETADISLVIDSTEARVNNETIVLDAAPTIRGDITFVPVRFVTENMGFYVNFVPRTRSILITDVAPTYVNGLPLYEYETTAVYMLTRSMYPNVADAVITALANETAAQMIYFGEKAKQEQVFLTPESEQSLNEMLTANISFDPMLKGELMCAMEKMLLSSDYLSHVTATYKDAPETLEYYKNHYLCAKHILISGTDNDAKAIADGIYEKAIAGDNFDLLIAAYNEDPGMNANPKGYVFTNGEMVESFESATKALRFGEISQPVLSPYGYHIIQRQPLPAISDQLASDMVYKLYVRPEIEKIVVETK